MSSPSAHMVGLDALLEALLSLEPDLELSRLCCEMASLEMP